MNDVAELTAPEWASAALESMLDRCFEQARPRPQKTCLEWVEEYRILSNEESPDFGGDSFRVENIPVMRDILSHIGEKGVTRLVGQKSAQIAWTAGVVCSAMGYFTHWRPCVQIAMFPRLQSTKDFESEKFAPMVRATPVLASRVEIKSRAKGNTTTRKHYPGGLLKLVASNSPSDVKSTTAKVRYVEEPDDTNTDVRGQGKAIALLRERGKTVRNNLEIVGGTPTAKGASIIAEEMLTTDQRRFMVVCHDCGERHDLDFDNVHIPGANLTEEDLAAPDIDQRFPVREVYGRARWEEAFYVCPHCGSVWSDDERIANIRRTASGEFPDFGWVPTAQSRDIGYYFNELQSIFDGSRVPLLAQKYLKAKSLMDQGDASEMIAFYNNSRGICWEYRGELPEEDELRNRCEDYAEWSCPAGALVPKLTVDVQHNRLAVTCWVTGRGGERWLAYWGEEWGRTVVPHEGAWIALENLMQRTVRHASGAELKITAVAIDCSDGQTSDAVYEFVRRHHRPDRHVYAVKGASDSVGVIEIWSAPRRSVDPNKRATKAAKYGVTPHIVGTAKAKDLILGWSEQGGQVRLTRGGPGAMHWYKGVRDDFFEQILSEIKIPSRKTNRREWKPRTDRRNEALDCTVYDTWLTRQERLHLKRPYEWDIIEMQIKQGEIFSAAPAASVTPEEVKEVDALIEAVHTSAPPDSTPPEADPAPSTDTAADIIARLRANRRTPNAQRF